MSFIFSILDMLLIVIMLFDTLGLIYKFRKKEQVKPEEYRRINFSWILFLIIYSTFSCSWKGYFGTLIRLILFAAKFYVTVPILGGSLKIHKILIEDGKAEECFKKITELVKSKLCKCEKKGEEEQRSTDFNSQSETVEPEFNSGNNDLSNQ